MIGRAPARRVLPGLIGAVVLGSALAARPAAPEVADPPGAEVRRTTVEQTAEDLLLAIDELAELFSAAIDDARRGSALVIAGEDPPAPALLAAADRLEAGVADVKPVSAGVRRLSGRLDALTPAAQLPAWSRGPDDLFSIAGQLRQAAEAAGPFVERRQATVATLEALADALAALDADDPAAARSAIGRAAAARQQVADWDDPPVSLAPWLETTGAMLDAADTIAEAALAGDEAAAERGAAEYAAAAQRAGLADRALALSITEAGSAITRVPMRRLADASAELLELRAAVASVLHR